MTTEKDAFDQWWEWANKDRETDYRTIPGEIHYAVRMLTPEERKDRAIVNETVRTQATPWRLAGSADLYGAPVAEE
jgi:hypothetical protein